MSNQVLKSFAVIPRWVSLTLIIFSCCVRPAAGQHRLVDPAFGLAFATAPLAKHPPALKPGWSLNGVGRGFGFELNGGARIYRIVSVGGNFGFLLHTDSLSSSVSTTGGIRDTSVDSSYFSAYMGGWTPPLPLEPKKRWFFSIGAEAGKTWAGSLSKSIPRCVDCPESKADLRGGTYFEPAVRFHNAKGVGFGFGYRIYSGRSDLGTALLFKVGIN